MADIGATLREARMRARIDINEVETRTKIRAKYLRAIENEEWDLLPGPVYAKSFLRTYGDYLGLDSRQLIDDFKRRYERPSDHELRPIAAARAASASASAPRAAAAALGADRAACWWSCVVALYVVGTPRRQERRRPRRRQHPRAATPHAPRASSATAPPPVATPTTVKLQLVPTGPVYVCLVDGAGKQADPGQIFAAGQTIPTETAPKLLLTLGNARCR